jgi:hypothetical protein
MSGRLATSFLKLALAVLPPFWFAPALRAAQAEEDFSRGMLDGRAVAVDVLG